MSSSLVEVRRTTWTQGRIYVSAGTALYTSFSGSGTAVSVGALDSICIINIFASTISTIVSTVFHPAIWFIRWVGCLSSLGKFSSVSEKFSLSLSFNEPSPLSILFVYFPPSHHPFPIRNSRRQLLLQVI